MATVPNQFSSPLPLDHTEENNQITSLQAAMARQEVDPATTPEDFTTQREELYAQFNDMGQQQERESIDGLLKLRKKSGIDKLLQESLANGNVEDAQGLAILSNRIDTERNMYAIEDAAADFAIKSAIQDYHYASNLRNQQSSFLDDVNDRITTMLKVQNMLDSNRMEIDSMTTSAKVGDFAANMFDVFGYLASRNLEELEPEEYKLAQDLFDSAFPGQKVQDFKTKLFEAGTSKEERLQTLDNLFKRISDAGIFESNYRVDERLEELLNTVPEDKFLITVGGALNLVDIGAYSSLAKGVTKSSAKMLTARGMRKQTAQEVTNTLDKAAIGVDTTLSVIPERQAIEELLPSMLSEANFVQGSVGMSQEVADVVESNASVLKRINEIQNPSRLTQTELEEAVKFAQDDIREELNNFNISDVYTTIPENSKVGDDLSRVHALIGKRDGGGYKTEATARTAAKTMGLKNYDVVQDASGMFFPRVSKVVNEEGFIKGFGDTLETGSAASEFTKRALAGGRLKSHQELFSRAVQLESSKDAAIKEVIEPVFKKLIKLKSKDLKEVDRFLKESQAKEKWYTEPELRALNANDDQIKGYFTAVQLSNFEYDIHRVTQYKRMARLGYRTYDINNPYINFSLKSINGRDKSVADFDFNANRVWDVNGNLHFPEGTLTSEQIQKYIDEDYRVLSMIESDASNPDRIPVKHFLVKKDSISPRELDPNNILGYVEGGHRIYSDGRFYIKQANKGKFKDTGKEYLLNPLTHIVAKTKDEADKAASQLENVRVTYKAYKNGEVDIDDVLDALVDSPFKRMSLESLEDTIADGGFNLDTPIKAYKDREVPEDYRSSAFAARFDDTKEFEDGYSQWLMTTGKGIQSKRTKHLIDPAGNKAETLSPFDALNRGLQTVINKGVYENYKTSAIERWVKTASPYLEPASLRGRTAYEIFDNPSFQKDATEAIRNKLLANKGSIDSMLNAPTMSRRIYKETIQNIADTLEGRKAKVAYHIMDKNPVSAIKGAAFHAYLGLLNPAQLLVQANTAVLAVSVDPKNGLRAVETLPMLTHLTYNRTPALIDMYAKKFKVFHGMEVDEFKEFVKEFHNSGFGRITNSIAELDNGAIGLESGKTKRIAGKTSRFFFDRVENGNRTIAYTMAYRRVKAANPKLRVNSDEFRSKVLDQANGFIFDMNRAGNAAWNEGAVGMLTQFKSFPARYIERAFFKSGGLTVKERVALNLTQTALYGAVGQPFLEEATEYFEDMYGDNMPAFLQVVLNKGIIDGYVFSNLGIDTSDRFNANTLIPDIYDVLMGDSNKSFLDALNIPGISLATDLGDTAVGATMKIMSAAQTNTAMKDLSTVIPEVINDFGKLASSWNNVQKAKYMLAYGEIRNSNGFTVDKVKNNYQILAQAMGFSPSAGIDAYRLTQRTSDLKAEINQASDEVAKVYMKYFNEGQVSEEYVTNMLGMILYPYRFQYNADLEANVKDRILELAYDKLRRDPKALTAFTKYVQAYGKPPQAIETPEVLK